MSFNDENRRLAEAMQADYLMARLNAAIASNARYTEGQLDAAPIKLTFTPEIHAVLKEVAFAIKVNMTDLIREATVAKVQGILQERSKAGEVAQ